MNWLKKILGFSKKSNSSSHFDRRLVQNIRGTTFPSWKQCKYLSYFLTPTEKVWLRIWSTLFILGTVTLGITYFFNHYQKASAPGGEYSEAMIGQPKYLNPLFSSVNDIDSDLTPLIYSSLFHYSQGTLTGDLVQSHTLSPDQKTYDFVLRSDAYFSDGEKLTAKDVVYTFETLQNPETDSPLLSSFDGVTITQTGDFSFRTTLKEPFSPFLHTLTFGILPEHIWGNISTRQLKLAKNNLQPIGSGAWKFNKLVKNDFGEIKMYSLNKNTNYYGKKPLFDSLSIKFYDSYESALTALKKEEVESISFLPNTYQKDLSSRKFNWYSFKLPQYTALFFNQKNTLLKEAGLREALATAINKEKIVNDTLEHKAEIINGLFLPGTMGYTPDLKTSAFNLDATNATLDKKWPRVEPSDYFDDRSQELLDEYIKNAKDQSPSSTIASSTLEEVKTSIAQAVQEEMSAHQSFYRKNKAGDFLRLTITTANTPDYQKVAEEIAHEWMQVGVLCTVQTFDPQEISKKALRGRNFDILLYGEIVGGDSDPFSFWHSSQADFPGLNLAQFKDRSADKLLEDARHENDPTKRAELYKKFQTLLMDNTPAVFLYTPYFSFIANKQIQGVNLPTTVLPSDRYNELSTWYSKTRWQKKK